MDADWLAFLQARGARFEGSVVAHFGDAPAEARAALDGDVIADLSAYGLIGVSGDDAPKFLQGQFTNDVRELTEGHSQMSAWCSPKGRVLACLRVLRRGDEFLLQLPASLLEDVLARLRLFVLRARVELRDASGEYAVVGVAGNAAATALEGTLGSLPARADDVSHAGQLAAIRLPGPRPRFELLAPPAAMTAFWSELEGAARPVGAPAWSLLEIHAGVPTVHAATADEFIPQMLNLDALHAVSFTKGCYTGQEIVARTQYLGRLKRRLYRAHVAGEQRPVPGAGIVSGGSTVGRLLNVAARPDGGFDVLAVLQVDAADTADLAVEGHDGRPQVRLTIQPLPYPVPEPSHPAAG